MPSPPLPLAKRACAGAWTMRLDSSVLFVGSGRPSWSPWSPHSVPSNPEATPAPAHFSYVSCAFLKAPTCPPKSPVSSGCPEAHMGAQARQQLFEQGLATTNKFKITRLQPSWTCDLTDSLGMPADNTHSALPVVSFGRTRALKAMVTPSDRVRLPFSRLQSSICGTLKSIGCQSSKNPS